MRTARPTKHQSAPIAAAPAAGKATNKITVYINDQDAAGMDALIAERLRACPGAKLSRGGFFAQLLRETLTAPAALAKALGA